MFEKTDEELKALGAYDTTREIAQQPDLWEDTDRIWSGARRAVDAFLAEARAMAGGPLRVIFTGAGTSAYVGDTVAPYLTRTGDTGAYRFCSVPTTDIVSAPLDYLVPDEPCLLVSFARSGNSPESVAAVERARQAVSDLRLLNITCAPDGALARAAEDDPQALNLLIPRANDRGFAMTGSYTCMTLLAALVFDRASDGEKDAWVRAAAAMGREVTAREDEVAALLGEGPSRLTYLGSGPLSGLAREAQLKILELAAGRTATSFDSSMGYRHGPKSFVDEGTVLVTFVSEQPYTRRYDLDILAEVAGDGIAARTVAVQQAAGPIFEGDAFTFAGTGPLPGAYLALPFAMVAQTVALLNSVRLGNTPDTPSPSGTVNRVVKGVTIHELEL